MANLQDSIVTILTETNTPTLPQHAARMQELWTGLSGVPGFGHKHVAADITDLSTAVAALVAGQLEGSVTVVITPDGPRLRFDVGIHPGSPLFANTDGLDIRVGVSGVAAWDHTHDQLHDPLTFDNGSSRGVSGTVDINQVLALSLVLMANSGLLLGLSGLGVDFGSGHNQVMRGDTVAANDHPALTVASTQSLDLYVDASQLLSGVTRLDPNPGSGKGKIKVGPNGIYVDLGTGDDQAAAGNHGHAVATPDADGFLSAADKRKLDAYASILQTDAVATFTRHDALSAGEYVGGRGYWGQAIQITRINLTASGPSQQCLLGVEIGGVVLDTIAVPGSSPTFEVTNAKDFTDLYCAADTYLRIVGLSGVGQIENEPSRLDVVVTYHPAIATAPTVQINAGGTLQTPFSADQFYSGGFTASTSTACDTSAVSSPAPAAVYGTVRRVNSNVTIAYQVTGLARGINYKVRLHFNQFNFFNTGDEVFRITVTGASVQTSASFDILAATGGARNKAVIQEYTVAPDANGEIQVQLQPIVANGGDYNASICGLEFLPQV